MTSLAALQQAIAGEVIAPESAQYDAARMPQISLFEKIRPDALVRCRTAADVAETLRFVRGAGARVAVRGGATVSRDAPRPRGS